MYVACCPELDVPSCVGERGTSVNNQITFWFSYRREQREGRFWQAMGVKPVCTMEEELARVAHWYRSTPRLNTQRVPVQRGRDYAD